MAKFKNQDLILDDNEQILLGDDDDASIKWDGSDLVTNQIFKHSTQGYYATRAFVEQTVAGLEWQDSVLSKVTNIPGAPSQEDRYIVPSGASGAWSGLDDSIAEWSTTWDFTTPSAGFSTWVEDEGVYYIYNGSTWIKFGGVVDHGNLLGLSDDDHTQYHNDTRGDARYYTQSQVTTISQNASAFAYSEGVDYTTTLTLEASANAADVAIDYVDTLTAGLSAAVPREHDELTGLLDDDHTIYYHVDGRRAWSGTLTVESTGSIITFREDLAYIGVLSDTDLLTLSPGDVYIDGDLTVTGTLSGDHSTLFNLDADDHTQYHNNTRGDARYYTQSVLNSGQLDTRYYTETEIDDNFYTQAEVLSLTQEASANAYNNAITYADTISASLDDHGALDGLLDDDHTQYHNDTRGDARYYTQAQVTTISQNTSAWAYTNAYNDAVTYADEVSAGVIKDHGQLLGLSDDDHTQYHNDTRGDARYYTQSGLNSGQLDNRYYTETEVDTISANLSAYIDNSIGDIDFSSVSSDILPTASDTYDIGHSDAVWDNIWCKTLHTSAGSIELGNVVLTDVGGVLTSDSNIEAPYIIGDGSGLSNVSASLSANVDNIGIEEDGNTLELKDNIIILSYVSATTGGTPTAGGWYTRPLNTEVHDPNNWASVSSNQFTLVAGTYIIRAFAAFYRTNSTQIRLRNVTDSTYWYGTSNYAAQGSNVGITVQVYGAETIASSKTYRIEYQVSNAPSDGLGVDPTYANNTFMYVIINRIK